MKAEREGIREKLAVLEALNLITVVYEPSASIKDVIDFFNNPKYQNYLKILHFAGHGDADNLYFEEGQRGQRIDGTSFAEFLSKQKDLIFAFFNACSTKNAIKALSIPVAISTDYKVKDSIAKQFAITFYDFLSNAKNSSPEIIEKIPKAFEHAVHSIAMQNKVKGEYQYRELYRGAEFEDIPNEVPWELIYNYSNHAINSMTEPNNEFPLISW